ncbi:DUF300 domain-containing protein [Amanita rubescens]|nr:DUF300 domain-containing protein [Amanita rubescens]
MAGSGSGSSLPVPVLILAGVCTFVAVLVSAVSILLQLRNYRKPLLQRMVVRIMIMVPLYAIASFISLFSLEAAFVIDAIRDIYEAFIIYCFFSLLLSYLGGERSLLFMLLGRSPKTPPFPVNLFKQELDVSDPHTFLFLKRGIIQYVQVKPILAAATLILKACGWYHDGDFRANSGYLYVSIVYNVSICLALYCLAMFWLCVNDDLKPYRPVPKFLCVKGILFFSFWQSIVISILVAADVITRLGPYTDPEHISVGLNDTLICIEMPFFSLAHLYAFNYTDYIDSKFHFCARMPLHYAFLDAFGFKDVVQDTKATLRGKGMNYREFEPAEGEIHQGAGRDRRIRAGLRYSKGGKKKYWLPKVRAEALSQGAIGRAADHLAGDAVDVHAPLLGRQAEVRLAPDMMPDQDEHEDPMVWGPVGHGGNDTCGYELPFGDLDPADDALFDHSRQYLFGDYNYPVIDVSDEGARVAIWHEEERVLRDERGAWQSPIRNVQVGIQGKLWEGYGAIGTTEAPSRSGGKDADPSFSHEGDTEHPGKMNEARSSPAAPVAHKGLLAPAIQRVTYSAASSAASSVNQQGSSSTSSGVASSSSTTIHQHRFSPTASKTSLLPTPSPSPKPNTKSEKSKSKEKAKDDKSPVRSALSRDAIDLVVEDPKAAAVIQEQRHSGEPSFRKKGGLKRVYRREPTQDEQQREERISRDEQIEEREVPVYKAPYEELVGSQSVGGMEVFDQSVGDAGWGNDDASPPTRFVQEDTTNIVRAGTPPTYVRMMYDELEDDNPWA